MPRQRPSPSSYRGKTPRRSSSRHAGRPDEPVPQIYQDMLIEISSSSSGVEGGRRRPVKRRKVGERKVTWVDSGENEPVGESKDDGNAEDEEEEEEEASTKQVQMTYVSDGSDESDMEWEEVDLQQNVPGQAPVAASAGDDAPLQLTLGNFAEKGKPSVAPRRKPVTAAEKRWRLSIHKVHLLCLLGHLQLRNLWLNDEDVQVNGDNRNYGVHRHDDANEITRKASRKYSPKGRLCFSIQKKTNLSSVGPLRSSMA